MTLPCIRPPPSQSSLRKHSAVISWRTSRGYPGTPKLERRGHQQANHRDSPAAAPWGIGTPQSAGGPCRPVQGGIPPLPHPGGGDPAPALCPPCRTDTAGGGPLQQRQPAGPCGQHLWYGGLLHGGGNDPAGTGCLEGYKGVVVANLRLDALRAHGLEQKHSPGRPAPIMKRGGEHSPTPAASPSTGWRGRWSMPSTRGSPAAGRMWKTSAPSWARP